MLLGEQLKRPPGYERPRGFRYARPPIIPRVLKVPPPPDTAGVVITPAPANTPAMQQLAQEETTEKGTEEVAAVEIPAPSERYPRYETEAPRS